ncbi:unnamed protein product [Paramecium primaurelia]|uniref:Uncharacterized protein n=1 Tax=Paramecium primaurelia TaxID=5886 RepID=A0A8S1NPL8_PARPR|nr:unnamed protein product [Paramecium primaurelia]
MMKVISRMSSSILKKQDDMILFAYDNQVKQGEVLKFGKSLGVVMSIFEKNQLALLLQKSEVLEPIQHINSLKAYPQNNVCTIADIKESNENNTDSKLLPKRVLPQNQILTHNVYIDLFHPITYGQMLIIKDKELLKKLNAFDQIIYYGKSPIQTATWFKHAESQGSNYFLPKYALEYANQIARSNKTLLVMDQIYDHFVAHQKLQETIQSYLYEKTTKTVYLSNLLKDLSQSCGYRPGHSNLTVAVLQKDSRDDLLNDELEKELDSLQSHTPSATLAKPSPLSVQIQSPLYYHLAQELYDILSQYNQKKSEYMQKQQLKIHIDPWDFYEYFDCKPIVQMINLFNQQNSQEHELAILVDFSVKAFKQELICQLKGSPKEALNDLLAFSCSIKEFDKKTFAEFYYEKKNELDGNQFKSLIIESLGRFYELYMIHLRMTDQLLQYKKDYI